MPLIVAGSQIEEFRAKNRGFWIFAWITFSASMIGIGSFFVLFGHPLQPCIGWLASMVSGIATVSSIYHWWFSYKIEFDWQDNADEDPIHIEYLEPTRLQAELSKIVRPLQYITLQDDPDEPREVIDARRLLSAKISRRVTLFFYMPLMQAINAVMLAQLITSLGTPH